MICGPAAGAAHGLSGLTPAGKAPRRAKFLYAALLATTALVPVSLARPAAAQTVEWNGSASGDWNTAGNWDTNAVPTAADDVVINDTSSNTAVIGAAVNAQANGLTVGDTGLSADNLFILGGGTLTTAALAEVGVASDSSGAILVTGIGSQWNSSDYIQLGIEGTGGLNVINGGEVTSSTGGILGVEAGSFGIASIDGIGSNWGNTGPMTVGFGGEGLLTITGQGHVSNTQGIIALGSGSKGKVTVSDAGSTWANSHGVFVGYSGDGTLEILNGGDVTSSDGALGMETGGSGSTTVSGVGSTWAMTGLLAVGYEGTGVLTIENGGQVTNTGVSRVGAFSGGIGNATVTGVGSSWTSSQLFVGSQGTGTVTVSDAGTLTSTLGYIGAGSSIQGAVTVTGAGSNWANTGDFYVGAEGDGTLDIANQGAVNVAGNSIIGSESGSEGTATVTGAGSLWDTTGSLTVGQLGIGTLTVENQGEARAGMDAYVGRDTGSTGTLTVTGAGTSLDVTNNFLVGIDGQGTLSIADGGQVTVGGFGMVGASGVGVGAATVTDASWTLGGFLRIGQFANGTLTIDNGLVANADGVVGLGGAGVATVTNGSTWSNSGVLLVGENNVGELSIDGGSLVTNTDARVGGASSVAGTVTVSGAGSAWTSNGNLTVGQAGIGTLTVEGGGTVSDTLGFIGFDAGSSGTATVTGAGSTWTNSSHIAVGQSGEGVLAIADGGHVTNGGAARIAALPGSTGEVSVTGAGSDWTSSASLFVGAAGTGTLTIADGGAVSAIFSDIGADFNSSGMATVTGAGSTWNIVTTLAVGGFGKGAMTVADQAAVNVGGDAWLGDFAAGNGAATITGAGSLFSVGGALVVGDQGEGTLAVLDGAKAMSTDGVIGQFGSGAGEVTVSGANSLWELTGGYFAVGESGTGTLTIADGGLVNMADNLGFTVIGASGVGEVNVVDASWINGGVLVVGNSGTGVLTLDNATLVNSGGVVGGGPGSSGAVTIANGSTWTNNGQLLVGSAGTGEVTIESGGIIDAGIVTIAQNAGSQGMLNIGAAAGDAPAAAGTLATTDLTFGAGVGTLVFNHTSQDYLFSPEIDGVGAIDALAGRTLLATAGTYTGSTTIHDGATLSVDGSIGGTLDVLSGGRLEGSGTSGFVTVAGVVAPGNSIGTLHVAGDYTQVAGSTYEVEIDAAGNSDLIDVTGMATLTGGTVEVVPFPDFAIATPYTILTAAGGVTGTFDDVSMASSSIFLLPQLTYDANNAFFTISQNASFDSAALTPNQKAAAEGADSLGAGNAVWDAIALLGTQEQAQAAFDAISGEVHASAASVLIEDSRFVREAMDARLRAAFAGVGAKAMPVLAYGDEGPEAAPADTDRFAAWGHAFGSWGEWDSDGNAASLTRDVGGFVLGGDMAVADIWRLGLLAGYSSSSFDIDDRASSGSADSYHLGAYAGTKLGRLGLRFGGAYSWHDVDTARMAAFAGFTDSLAAEYDAATAQVFAEAGYQIDTAHISFEPFANLAYVNLHTDGFTEQGGPAALTASSSSQNTTFTTLGLRAETTLPLKGMTARLHGMLGWRHAFGDVSPTSNLAFAGGSAFTIAGVPIAEDAAIIEAGLRFDLGANASLNIAYNGQIGDGVSDHGAKAWFSVKF